MEDNAMTITDDELACFYITSSILHRYNNLNDNIDWAKNYITSVYSSNKINDKQLVTFFVMCNQNSVGKLALTFNKFLVEAINNKDHKLLYKLLHGSEHLFPELTDNKYLSTKDKSLVIDDMSKDISSISLMLDTLRNKISGATRSHHGISYKDKSIQNINYIQKSEILSVKDDDITMLMMKCHDKICIQDLSQDIVNTIISRHNGLPETISTIDKPEGSPNVSVYCIDTIELLQAMMDNVPINPKSKQPFSQYTLQLINNRFSKEIAMYRRFYESK